MRPRLIAGIIAGCVGAAAQPLPHLVPPVIRARDEDRYEAMKSAPVILLAEFTSATPSSAIWEVDKPAEVGGPMSPTIPMGLMQISARVLVTIRGSQRDTVLFPVESVFSASNGPGWRAREKGEQQIRIIFDQPMSVRRILLKFIEAEVERTQEFTIRWASAQGGTTKEVVRQQWNFSPTGSSREVEDYEVYLDGVSALELAIRPDLGRGDALATLAEWRIA